MITKVWGKHLITFNRKSLSNNGGFSGLSILGSICPGDSNLFQQSEKLFLIFFYVLCSTPFCAAQRMAICPLALPAFLSLHNLFSYPGTVCCVYVKIEDIYENLRFGDCIAVEAVQVADIFKPLRANLYT